jgi:hypothetical protein
MCMIIDMCMGLLPPTPLPTSPGKTNGSKEGRREEGRKKREVLLLPFFPFPFSYQVRCSSSCFACYDWSMDSREEGRGEEEEGGANVR